MSFVAGDTGSKLKVTCQDDDSGNAINLTGSTVKLKWDDADGALQTKTMTITDAVNGIAEYQFLASELFSRQMKFEVEITDSGGKVLHSLELIRENVREVLA